MTVQSQKQGPAEKRAVRFQEWMTPPRMQFAGPEAEQAFKARVQMFMDVIDLKRPQRVPVVPLIGFYPCAYAGISARDAMYDYAKLGYALKKYHADFLPDSLTGSPTYGPGKVFEILDYKLYHWPGHGVPDTAPYQALEAEYMKADEYDALINDPSAYFMRGYLPRVFGALSNFSLIGPFTDILELPFTGGSIIRFGLPPVQKALKTLMEAGEAALEWIGACRAIDGETTATLGLPGLTGGFTIAPFDILGDTLRGTRAIMLDMFRQPGKLLAAMERFVPLAIDLGVRSATNSRNPVVFIPLHKGADGFMSNDDFKKFYWPTLKTVILGLINEGLIPYLFVEGGYNQRLDIITDPDIPAGSTIWMFDQTDMREVKKRFTGWACFGGNVPASMLKAAKPAEIKDYVKRLIDDVAGDGGYMLATGAVLDVAEAENLHAMIDAGKEYGVYR